MNREVFFYKKLGFVCEFFEEKYENRYRCYLDLSASFYKLKEKLDRKIENILPIFSEMHGELAVACGSDILYHSNFSYLDAPWKVGKGSQYLIGSITKQFTAAALLRALYDRQKVLNTHGDIETIKMLVKKDLQKPISQFLPQGHPAWQSYMPGC